MFKYHYMKTFKNLLFLCFLVVLAACSEDAFVPQQEVISAGDDTVDLISMVVPNVEIADATTRSKLYEDGDELKFSWQENDAIGVVPMVGNPLHFPIHAENAGTNTALFDGGDWALKTSSKYAAFFPIDAKNQNTDIKHIQVDYTGQTQSNWMKYDFMATGAIQPKDGEVAFTMQRLSAILKIRVYISAGIDVHYCSLKAPDAVFGLKGTLDLSGTDPVYTPEVLTKYINTDLGVDKTSSGEYFTFYLMLPPTNLSGKLLTFNINSDSGTAQQFSIAGLNYESGKAYYVELRTATDPFITNSKLISAAGLSDVAESNGVNVRLNRERILQVTTIDVHGSGNKDPTVCDEIGYFRNLEELICYGNNMTSLDVSNNPELKILQFHQNSLTSLDISNNTALQYLSCGQNQLTSLDVSNNTLLEELKCYANQLTSLDVSNNRELKNLICYNNTLTSLDISNNSKLENLSCQLTQLTSLDVSHNPVLTTLNCSVNSLTSLDVSQNSFLTSLDCYSNQLASLNVFSNSALTKLYCYQNLMSALNITRNTSLAKESVRCGGQYTDKDKTTEQILTLTARAADTTELKSLNSINGNKNVTVINE